MNEYQELEEIKNKIEKLQKQYDEKLRQIKEKEESISINDLLYNIDEAIKATCFNHNYEETFAIRIIKLMLAGDAGKTGEYEYISAAYDDGVNQNSEVRENIINEAALDPLGLTIISHFLLCRDKIRKYKENNQELPPYLEKYASEIDMYANKIGTFERDEALNYLKNLTEEEIDILATIFVETRYNFSIAYRNSIAGDGRKIEEETRKVEVNPELLTDKIKEELTENSGEEEETIES